MTQSSRTFRVFVSSTFSDLKAERNALQERVFPRLRELCSQHGCRFQAIDLRWGVSEEAALDQQAMRICLEEVERCQKLSPRPNFIVLLGDRYGWQPLPYEIPAAEYGGIIQQIDPAEKAFLEKWYRLDENAIPPAYDLLPREGKHEELSAWEPIEKELLRILRKGIEKVSLPGNLRLKYFSSATEQEIYKGALDEPGAKEHVFCFLRQINGLPNDNTAKDFIDLDKNGRQDTEAHERLTRLKERLRNDLPGNVHEYTDCQWTGNGITSTHIDKLCDDVYEELSGIITQELATLQQIAPLEQDIADHAAFAEERARHFTGRTEIQEKVLAYLNSDIRGPLAIFGEGGSGKSALMAQVFKRIAGENTNAAVVSRFIGATPSSSNIFSLLESLCKQIAEKYGADASTPTEYKELVEDFHKKLVFATAEKPLIIMLDALDQLSEAENAESLQWLPIELPEHVRAIVSVLNPSEYCDQLKRRLPEEQLLQVGLMGQQEGEALLELWLKEAKRVLQQTQRQDVLSKFRQCGLPLYLKIAFEEAQLWKSYTLGEISGTDVQGIILEFLGNLSEESRHGKEMVKHALGYLATGKNGLTEEEMLDLLSLDTEVKEAFWRRSPNSPKTDKLPVVVWSRLYLDLRPYLTERVADQTSVMTFFHRQFGEVVRNNYLDAETNKELHRRIAGYFGAQPYQYLFDGKKPHYRKVSEIAYQMMQGEMWEELEKTLMDFDYPMTKCMAGMVDELAEDYQKANASPVSDKQSMRILAAFFREKVHILRRIAEGCTPEINLLQLAVAHADMSPVTKAAEAWLKINSPTRPWLRLQNRPHEVPDTACLRSFEGREVSAITIHPDGRRAISGGRGTITVWDIESGACLRVIIAHTDWVSAIAIHPDGRRAISAGDTTLKVWDIDTGACIHLFEGHTWSVTSVAIHPDGRRAISGSGDRTIRVWDLESGISLRTLAGNMRAVDALSIVQNGQHVISASTDHMINLWDLESGECIHTLDRNTSWDIIVAIHPDGLRAISANHFGPLKLWNIQTGEVLRTLEGHTQRVTSVAIHPDGRSILSAGQDKTLRLWDLETGLCTKTIEVPMGLDTKVVFHPDGVRAISGGFDSIKLWDLTATGNVGVCGDEHEVQSAAIHPNGRYAISAHIGKNPTLWELADGRVIRPLDGDEYGRVEAIAIDQEGRLALMACGDHPVMLKLVDLESGACIRELHGHQGRVTALAIYPDGRRAISASDHYTLNIWDIESGECLRTLKEQPTVVALAIHSDARHAIVGTYDGSLEMWDMEKPEGRMCVRVIEGAGHWISAVALDVYGKHLVCARRRSLYIRDIDTGKLLACWEGDGTWFKTCSLSHIEPLRIIAVDRYGEVISLQLMKL